MSLRFIALSSDEVATLQAGGPDANGQIPERHISDGDGVPCRHCLRQVARGDAYLILGYRPFPEAQPYAEIGPIFLHADSCPRFVEEEATPPIFGSGKDYLIRGYGHDDRIVYGSGKVVPRVAMRTEAERIFEDPRIDYIHVRSSTNNCYQCRIERA